MSLLQQIEELQFDLMKVTDCLFAKAFDSNQPRDKSGKWSKFLYHFTDQVYPPTSILPGSHFGTLQAAMTRGYSTGNVKGSKVHVYDYLPLGRSVEIKDSYDSDGDLGWIKRQLILSDTLYTSEYSNIKTFEELATNLKAKGVSTLHYRNAAESIGSTSHIVFDTENLQHIHSFDNPKFMRRKYTTFQSPPFAREKLIKKLEDDLSKIEKAFNPDEPRDKDGKWVEASEFDRSSFSPENTPRVFGNGRSKEVVVKVIQALPRSELNALGPVHIRNESFIRAADRALVGAGYIMGMAFMGLDKIVIPDMVKIGPDQFVMNNDIGGNLIHEVGHLRDYQLKFPSLAMQTVISNDGDKLTDQEKEYAKYYFSNHSEMFAELYRTALGRHHNSAFGMKPDRARKVFSNSINELHKTLNIVHELPLRPTPANLSKVMAMNIQFRLARKGDGSLGFQQLVNSDSGIRCYELEPPKNINIMKLGLYDQNMNYIGTDKI